MDTVRGRRTIRVTKKGDTLSASLISNKPLIAKYQDNVVIGSWALEANQRTIVAQILTTLSSFPIASTNISNIEWRFNGSVIADNNTNFTKTTAKIGSTTVPALIVKGDIMASITTASSIEFSADVYSGGFTTKIYCSISVLREQVSANTYTAYILDKSGKGATITTDTPTLVLEAFLEKGGVEVTSGLNYKWYKMTLNSTEDASDGVTDNRVLIANAIGKTITLTAKDISTYDTYQVEISEGSTFIKSAIISVRDETDALDIQYNITGAEQNLDTGGSVLYTPKVVLQGTTTVAPGTWTFAYQKVKTDGTLIGAKYTGASYTVTYADVESAGGEIDVLFEATEA